MSLNYSQGSVYGYVTIRVYIQNRVRPIYICIIIRKRVRVHKKMCLSDSSLIQGGYQPS